MDHPIYKLPADLSIAEFYVGSYVNEAIKINRYLICPCMYKIFYNEGYIKSKGVHIGYTISGRKINLLEDSL